MSEEPEFSFYDIRVIQVVEEEGRLYEEGLTPPVCDFCEDTRVRWEYDCGEFVLEELGRGSDSGWLACDRCAALIEALEIDALVERSLKSWSVRMGTEFSDRVGLRQFQAGFFAHRGDRRAFG